MENQITTVKEDLNVALEIGSDALETKRVYSVVTKTDRVHIVSGQKFRYVRCEKVGGIMRSRTILCDDHDAAVSYASALIERKAKNGFRIVGESIRVELRATVNGERYFDERFTGGISC